MDTNEYPEALMVHRYWMQKALQLGQQAGDAGDIPVGAIVIDNLGNCIAQAENRRERDRDPTAHAEILALRQAGQQLGTWKLDQCTLYVNLEPCPMCAGAIILARPALLVYGADDPKTGAIRTILNLPDSLASNHKLQVFAGILEADCRSTLQSWFSRQRLGKPLTKKQRMDE